MAGCRLALECGDSAPLFLASLGARSFGGLGSQGSGRRGGLRKSGAEAPHSKVCCLLIIT